MSKLTHLNAKGSAAMVDVGSKPVTQRIAVAVGTVKMAPETLELIQNALIKKGDVLAVARIAGIMAAKKTAELIPLCHPIPLTNISILFYPQAPDQIWIRVVAKSTDKTGVEMEALTGVTIAALTLYDMCKAVDRSMKLGPFELQSKSGGKSGSFYSEIPGLPTNEDGWI